MNHNPYSLPEKQQLNKKPNYSPIASNLTISSRLVAEWQ